MKGFGLWMLAVFVCGALLWGCDSRWQETKPKESEGAGATTGTAGEGASDSAGASVGEQKDLDKPTPKVPSGAVSPKPAEDQIPIEAVPYKPDASKKKGS